MATRIESTALDFTAIKAQLKAHFASQSEFADFDFEASGLSNILDVLAYNTHYNGLIANFALNEAFLGTAQLRSSVLGISQALGYNPRSKRAAMATVSLSVNITGTRPTTITIPAGTQFSAKVDDVDYSFQTIEDVTATDNGSGYYQFLNSNDSEEIAIYEGSYKTKTFIVNDIDDPVYVIKDINMDTSTAAVDVYESYTSTYFTSYTPLADAKTINSTSTYYILREAANGYYEINFGDGVATGRAPVAGEVIRVTYISTNGIAANTARGFTTDTVITVGSSSYPVSVTTVARAAGGADKESISSIKNNAPKTFASQNRMVTADDYIASISSAYGNYLDDVSVWGGEDAVPVDYGKIYIALKFKSGITDTVQQNVRNEITNILLANKGIMSLTPVYTNVNSLYLIPQTTFNYNPTKSSIIPSQIESIVQNTIQTYFLTNFRKFNKVFRRSTLLGIIDDLNEAILNSRMDVLVGRRFIPLLTQTRPYTIRFPIALSAPKNDIRVITSSLFSYNGRNVYFRNKLSSNIIELVDTAGNIVIANIGSYSATNGTIDIQQLKVDSIIAPVNYIKAIALPANQSTIRPLRNYVIDFDPVESFTSVQLDYENISVSL